LEEALSKEPRMERRRQTEEQQRLPAVLAPQPGQRVGPLGYVSRTQKLRDLKSNITK
jgi:hypothetical protein